MVRLRCVFGLLLAVGLLFCPSPAFASDGFLGGLEDLVGTRETEPQSYERDFQDGYEPELREVDTAPVRTLADDATTVDYINNTLDSFNTVNWGNPNNPSTNNGLSLLRSVQVLLGSAGSGINSANMTTLLILPAIGIVFMWWGVRKAKNIVMNGFKKGKITT